MVEDTDIRMSQKIKNTYKSLTTLATMITSLVVCLKIRKKNNVLIRRFRATNIIISTAYTLSYR